MTSKTISLQGLKCKIGLHKLHVVHRFGSAALVACPACNKEFAMHDGMRVFLPWDGDIESLYVDMGYDVAGSRAEWRRQKGLILQINSDRTHILKRRANDQQDPIL